MEHMTDIMLLQIGKENSFPELEKVIVEQQRIISRAGMCVIYNTESH
jgi:hypothetical protein